MNLDHLHELMKRSESVLAQSQKVINSLPNLKDTEKIKQANELMKKAIKEDNNQALEEARVLVNEIIETKTKENAS